MNEYEYFRMGDAATFAVDADSAIPVEFRYDIINFKELLYGELATGSVSL